MRTLIRYIGSHHVGLLALFVALTGTAYAATLPPNSVGTAQQRKNAVTSARVEDGSLRKTGFALGQFAHAHVRADGRLDRARSTAGISMSRVRFGDPSPAFFPVYCFDLPQRPVNVVATPEKSTRKEPDYPIMSAVELNATVERSVIAEWGCPARTDAAVLSSQRPNSPLYAAFR